MPSLPAVVLLLSISLLVAAERCTDESEFCRYLKTFCASKDHEVLMRVKCAATCGFCEVKKETAASVVDVILPKNLTQTLRARPNSSEELNTTTSSATTQKKCVFPKEKMLTTALPGTADEYRFTANVSVVKKVDETIQTVLVQTVNSTRVRQAPDSNEALKRVAEARRNESVFGGEQLKETMGVMRKIKPAQLISEKDLDMPRITSAEPTSFTVSLAKTLIKGTCFDEYVYCAEFSSLCSHPAFGDVMASHCTLTCKRCDEVDQTEAETESMDCVDLAPDCSKYSDVCHDERYITITQKYCAKSCGHCKSVCRDRHPNCAQFALDGFCADEAYTTDERKFLCGTTCGAC